jgi:hypothetical protein
MDAPVQDPTSPLGADLLVGAEPIAQFLYGDPKKRRDIYRNPAGLSIFRLGAQLAARKSTLRAEILERENAARELNAQAALGSRPVRPQPKRRAKQKA